MAIVARVIGGSSSGQHQRYARSRQRKTGRRTLEHRTRTRKEYFEEKNQVQSSTPALLLRSRGREAEWRTMAQDRRRCRAPRPALPARR